MVGLISWLVLFVGVYIFSSRDLLFMAHLFMSLII